MDTIYVSIFFNLLKMTLLCQDWEIKWKIITYLTKYPL